MRITIRGHNLPGRRFCEGENARDNVHVGLQERREPVGLMRADAKAATWDVDVKIVTIDDGQLDFRGPVVQGKRGERFVYLTWGNVSDDGEFDMFRRAKLMLDADVTELVQAARRDHRTLVASVDLTDRCGGPRCARLKSDALTWSVE
ncbi:MAG TPA: DUF5990 family protein [Acidimicrobiales bacterium]|nr:DUF5990 family protein [Acidimicrobiales bacterium]